MTFERGEAMTEAELAEIEALAKAATPGPWKRVFGDGEYFVTSPTNDEDNPVMSNTDFYPAAVTAEDQAFCAAARSAVPLLIAEVRRLRALVESAYREGWKEMEFRDSYGDEREVTQLNFDWEESAARKALGEP